jgi:large conductance mechanosensitive channel
MSIGQEFKEFILRSKVVDLAVGVAVGGAFTKVVENFVQNIIMPFFSLFARDFDFSHYRIILRQANQSRHITEVAINYGMVINSMLTFLIVGFAVFLFIKILNKIHKSDNTDQAKITNETLREIRDLLAKQNQGKDL